MLVSIKYIFIKNCWEHSKIVTFYFEPVAQYQLEPTDIEIARYSPAQDWLADDQFLRTVIWLT